MSCNLKTWIDTVKKLDTIGDKLLIRYKKGILECLREQQESIDSEEIKTVILDKIEEITNN